MQTRIRILSVTVIAMVGTLCDFAIVSANSNRLALVTLDAATYDSARTIIAGLEDRGFRVRHIFPPNHLIVEASESLVEDLRRAAGVSGVKTPPPVGAPMAAGGPESDIFDQILARLSRPPGADDDPTTGVGEPLTGCQITPKIAGPAESVDMNAAMQAAPSSDQLFTSQYLMGRVAVAILLVESTGNGENWTTSAEDSAIAGIVRGADLLTSRAEEHDVNVSWVYEIHRAIPTGFEPIQGRPMPEGNSLLCWWNWTFQWVGDVLAHLGYSSSWESAFRYANDVRSAYGADWAIQAYVVNAENKSSHKFDGGKGAYYVDYANFDFSCRTVRYQSPILALAYWSGYSDLWLDFAHETLHCFGGMGEYNTTLYGGYGCGSAGDCSLTSGYLHAPNGNCVYCPGDPANCLMYNYGPDGYPAICQYTDGHIGWRDSDGDGPVDAVDPHYPHWSGIDPVAPGDVVRIYTVALEGPVKKILCNESNVDQQSLVGYVIWDCLNNSGYHVYPGRYLVSVNGGELFQINTQAPDPAIKPSITGITFSGRLLSYRLENSFAYVRCFLYDENTGQLVGRPVWDRQRTADHTYSATVDTAALMGPAIARFYAWRAEGGASPVTEFPIAVPKRGDINVNNIAYEVGDAVLFSSYFVYGNAVWDPLHRDAQIGATDVNGDGQLLTLSDFVYLLRIVTRDCPPLGKPSVNLPTSSVSWETREDSLIVDWDSKVAAGAMLLHFDHQGGQFGQPALTDRARGLTVLSHDDGSQLRVLVYGMGKEGSIAAGHGPILTIPVTEDAKMSPTLSKVEAVDWSGNTIPAAGGASADLPRRFALYQNIPNPFNAATQISFYLPSEGEASLRVYNVLGQLIVNLVEGTLGPGHHEFTWGGADSHGLPVATGVYFYLLRTKDAVLSRKMVVLK